MMLKQAATSRNLKTRGFKVKNALKIFLLLAISIWLLYQVKQQSHFNNNISDPSSEKTRQANTVIKFGRKDLKVEKEEETEIDDNAKVEEINAMDMEGRGGGDDEIDGNDQERAEEEEEEEEEDDSDSDLEDLIDEEDREKEEATVVEEDTHTKEDGVSSRNEDEIGNLRKVKEEGLSFPEKKRVDVRDSIARDEDSSERM